MTVFITKELDILSRFCHLNRRIISMLEITIIKELIHS